MPSWSRSIRAKVAFERYLRCGEHDEPAACWPGGSALERTLNAKETLTAALLEEVRRRPGRVEIQMPAAMIGSNISSTAR